MFFLLVEMSTYCWKGIEPSSKNRRVSGLAPNLSKGQKWKPKEAVQEAKAAACKIRLCTFI